MHSTSDPLFLPVAFVKTTLPHSCTGPDFVRKNGKQTLYLRSDTGGPLPCGIYPRLILAHLTTAAVRSKSCEVFLERTVADLVRLLGAVESGGPNGASTRVREQWRRLTHTAFACRLPGEASSGEYRPIMWQVTQSRADGLVVVLSDRFFHLTRSAIPLDPALVRATGRSPFRFDLYAWTTYRQCTVQRPTLIPWMSLAGQFGANYGRPRDFRRQVRKSIAAIQADWPGACVEALPNGLMISPAAPSVQAWGRQRLHAADIDQEPAGKGWSAHPNAATAAPIQ